MYLCIYTHIYMYMHRPCILVYTVYIHTRRERGRERERETGESCICRFPQGFEFQRFPSASDRGPKDHVNIRISHSGSAARYMGDTRNCVFLVGSLCLCGLLGPDLDRFISPALRATAAGRLPCAMTEAAPGSAMVCIQHERVRQSVDCTIQVDTNM